MAFAYLGVVILLIVYIIYKLTTRNFKYWEVRGIPYVKPLPIVGNFYNVLLLRKTIGHELAEYYNNIQHPYFGIYVMNSPHLIIKDPNLIKSILVKDFNYFQDRTIISDEKCDSLTANMLFVIKNPEWKGLRNKMSPVFTTGKIKTMLNLIEAAGNDMVSYLNKNIHQQSMDAKEICAKYSTDVITSCAFGLNGNSFRDEDADFRIIGRKLFDNHWKTGLRQTSYFIAPWLVKLIRLSFLDPSIIVFMRSVFWKAIENRKSTNIKRNDLIDIIIKMKDEGVFENDIKFGSDRIVAQAGQFFAAGFETVSSTMSFTLYELCLNSKIQTKLRQEINSVLSTHGDKLTYDALQDMKYLHLVISETLRKYPVLPFLDRMCKETYKIPGSNHIIEKGTPVFISLFGLQYDKKYFPNPEKYDPERFNEENKRNLTQFSYLPFGDGPRNCIGERFGLLATKLGLVTLLKNFVVERSEETPVPIEWSSKTFVLISTVGLPMRFKPIAIEGA